MSPKVQFFQEPADAAVAITAAYGTARAQVVHLDGAVWTRKAQDHQVFPADAHLDGLPKLVRTVVDRVDYCLFDGRQREVSESLGLWAVRVFDDGFFQVVALDERDRIARDL